MMPTTWPITLIISLLIPDVFSLDVLPDHLHGGVIGRSFQQELSSLAAAKPQYLDVALDHFTPVEGRKWKLKFYVSDAHYIPGGVVLVTMPSEGPTGGCGGGGLAKALNAACICSQHRYFGDSVPFNDSSTTAFTRFLSVEQNLADIAALISHARSTLFPTASATVVQGGSYAGASSAWMRHAYPDIVDAAIAQSPPVTATYDFSAYDTSNLVALSSPDSRCAHTQAKVAKALTHLLDSAPAQLMRLFNASHFASAPMGFVDFAYALGDSSASAIRMLHRGARTPAAHPLHLMRSPHISRLLLPSPTFSRPLHL